MLRLSKIEVYRLLTAILFVVLIIVFLSYKPIPKLNTVRDIIGTYKYFNGGKKQLMSFTTTPCPTCKAPPTCPTTTPCPKVSCPPQNACPTQKPCPVIPPCPTPSPVVITPCPTPKECPKTAPCTTKPCVCNCAHHADFRDLKPPFDPEKKCSKTIPQPIKLSEVNKSALFPFDSLLHNKTLQKKVADNKHGIFMPVMTLDQKVRYVHMYLVIRHQLKKNNIEHFLLGGGLLGLYRQNSLVPWDHDIDLGIFFQDWDKTNTALRCIEGFTMEWMPWKNYLLARFSYADNSNIFIDLFTYGINDYYLYSVDDIRELKYNWRDVFPLKEVLIEGVPFYIPHNYEAIVKKEYTVSKCLMGAFHMPLDKSWANGLNPSAFNLRNVDCKELSYMYNFIRLE